MVEMQFNTVINRPVEIVFSLIADISNYGKWLSPSSLFSEVQQISDNPVRLGTTYIDGRSSTLRGEITEFQPPTQITFRQKTRSALGELDIQICYRLESIQSGTHVTRDITLNLRGLLRLAQAPLVNSIRAENERILARLKIYLETDAN